jgi:hypothetical protein
MKINFSTQITMNFSATQTGSQDLILDLEDYTGWEIQDFQQNV